MTPFSIESNSGVPPPPPGGRLQEMKAAHIVPDPFQGYAPVGEEENYPPSVTHHRLCVRVFVYAGKAPKLQERKTTMSSNL